MSQSIYPARIAIAQLSCHPYFTIGATDFSCEPLSPSHGSPILSPLIDHGFALHDLTRLFSERYNFWHLSRVISVIHSLYATESSEKPDLLVFPEGSIPFWLLPLLSQVAMEHNTTIFAGSHAFKPHDSQCSEALQYYDELASRKPENAQRLRDELRNARNLSLDTVSVMPVLLPDGECFFRVKQALSPQEHAGYAVHSAMERQQIEIPVITIPLRSRLASASTIRSNTVLRVAPYVCAEALQIPDTADSFDLAVVVSYNPNYQHFEPFVRYHTLRRVPVVYCNDGAFGDSCVSIPFDSRGDAWWFGDTNKGRLPPGDALLVMDVSIGAGVTVGTVTTDQPYALRRLSDVLPTNPEHLPTYVGRTLSNILTNVDEDTGFLKHHQKFVSTIEDFCERQGTTNLQQRKLPRLLNLLRSDSLTHDRWQIYTSDVFFLDPSTMQIYSRSLIQTLGGSAIVNRLNAIINANVIPPSRLIDSDQPTSDSMSVDDLEREFLNKSYLRIRQLLDDYLPRERANRSEALSQLVSARDRCASRLGYRAGAPLLGALWATLSRTEAEATEQAKASLTQTLGYFVERFHATCGWVFMLDDNKTTLSSVIAINTRFLRKKFGEGIVGYVASARRPYLDNNVIVESNGVSSARYPYRKYLSTTKAELAVPIISVAEPSGPPLGVLNLECRQKYAFLPTSIGDCQSASYSLLPDLRLLAWLKQNKRGYGWHPKRHGWTLTDMFNDICLSIASSLPGRSSFPSVSSSFPSVSCTIWMPQDDDNQKFSVRGTARFDYEYLKDRTLPAKSFIGSVFTLNKGEVRADHIERLDCFRRTSKADRMEVRKVIATPIWSKDANRCIGVLAIYIFEYQFGSEGSDAEDAFKPETVARVADILGGFIDNISSLQVTYAQDLLEARLREQIGDYLDIAKILSNVLTTCLDAAGCSVFMADEQTPTLGSKKLFKCVSTTGLSMNGIAIDGTEDILVEDIGINGDCIRAARYEVGSSGVPGFTRYLAQNPGTVLRRNEVGHSSGMSLPLEPRPANIFCERVGGSELEHHRFLGYSVKDDNSALALAVIRVVRRSESQPFFNLDDRIIRAVAQSAVAWLYALAAHDNRKRAIDLRREANERYLKDFSGFASDLQVKEKSLTRIALADIRTASLFYSFSNRKLVHSELMRLLQTFLGLHCSRVSLLILMRRENGSETWQLVSSFDRDSRELDDCEPFCHSVFSIMTLAVELESALCDTITTGNHAVGPGTLYRIIYPFRVVSQCGTLELCIQLIFQQPISEQETRRQCLQVIESAAHRLRSLGQNSSSPIAAQSALAFKSQTLVDKLLGYGEMIEWFTVFLIDEKSNHKLLGLRWTPFVVHGAQISMVLDSFAALGNVNSEGTDKNCPDRRRLQWELKDAGFRETFPSGNKRCVVRVDEESGCMMVPIDLGSRSIGAVVLKARASEGGTDEARRFLFRQSLLSICQQVDADWRRYVDSVQIGTDGYRTSPFDLLIDTISNDHHQGLARALNLSCDSVVETNHEVWDNAFIKKIVGDPPGPKIS